MPPARLRPAMRVRVTLRSPSGIGLPASETEPKFWLGFGRGAESEFWRGELDGIRVARLIRDAG
jgi:hypothetical protein